ncbi:hypothetical protein [Aquimarina sp. SS2-1]|uniref:hypothetical protein n=1 Tax=Aquimarina besae TaxID=3342247 RepID=UPI00366C4E7D
MSMNKLINMTAGPFGVWGAEKEIYNVFGENVGCKVSIFENNTNGNIRIQVRHNTDVSSKDWYDYIENEYIKAQVIHCRLSSNSTGGSVVIKVV